MKFFQKRFNDDLNWRDYLLAGLAILSFTVLVTLCSHKEERVSFQEQCVRFCKSIESEVLFCNPERKVTVCE